MEADLKTAILLNDRAVGSGGLWRVRREAQDVSRKHTESGGTGSPNVEECSWPGRQAQGILTARLFGLIFSSPTNTRVSAARFAFSMKFGILGTTYQPGSSDRAGFDPRTPQRKTGYWSMNYLPVPARSAIQRVAYLTVRRLSADDLPVFRSVTTSKDTSCPSLRPCIPARSTALMCTKTSLPPSCGWMKPKPFWLLNHFTVPCAIELFLQKMWKEGRAPARPVGSRSGEKPSVRRGRRRGQVVRPETR
jgi:hypothetical protein